jgi:uncharacterized protein
MTLHIIVDGYNLIRQSPRLAELDRRNLENARDALVRLLSEYKRMRRHRITVVFDGAHAPDLVTRSYQQQGIRILFSGPGETADAVIILLAAKDGEKALIVTSDREVATSAEAHMAATISSQAFERRLSMASGSSLSGTEDGSALSEDDLSGWQPTTKKKGPSRRDPKRVRRNQKKISKL